MMWLFAILVVLAMGAIAVVAAGRGAPMSVEYDDRPDVLVPAEAPVRAADLRRVRFSLAFRGYRMSEVDALLDRLATQLEVQDHTQLDPQLDPQPAPTPPRDAGATASAEAPADDDAEAR